MIPRALRPPLLSLALLGAVTAGSTASAETLSGCSCRDACARQCEPCPPCADLCDPCAYAPCSLETGDAPNGGKDGNIKHNRPDAHAPAGLMGAHVHKRGTGMVEYKFMSMSMEDNQVGSTRVSDTAALDALGFAFAVTPVDMVMDMHMLHFMYGLTDDVTLYIMPMWFSNTMDHIRRAGPPFRTHNEGFADMPFGALWRSYEGERDELIWNLGMVAPTGDIDNRVGGPGTPEFPYPMRLGTGSFAFRPGVTYKAYSERGSFGTQFQTFVPVGRNDEDYRVGSAYRLNFWLARRLGCEGKLAMSFRVENLWRENFDGADPDLNPLMVHTARPDMRGGYWLNFGYGVNWLLPRKTYLAFEWVLPVYQDLEGVQLQTDWTLVASLSKGFGKPQR